MRKRVNQTHTIDFEKTGDILMLWQLRAREFICAANILRAKSEEGSLFGRSAPAASRLSKPYNAVRLLYGLALENLLKGLLIARGLPATSSGKLSQAIHNHKLADLWRMAGFDLTTQTETILNGLRWSIESGKYPIGTRAENHDPHARQRAVVGTVNLNRIVEMIDQVEEALRQEQSLRVLERTDLRKLCYQ